MEEEGRKRQSISRDILFLLIKVLIFAGLVISIFMFLIGVMRYPDNTMEPSIKAGDLVVYYRMHNSYSAGDTVVVEYEGEKQVRRVVAAEGDTVDIREEGLYVNGYLQEEPDIRGETKRFKEGPDFPITLEGGEYFLLADAREEGADSRIYGAVSSDKISGKVIMTVRVRNI